jgi:erythronate-4-phosphate dehydrogenase
MINIVCCESVTEAYGLFSLIGHVTIVPDAALTAAILCNADALIVRSLRKIDASLLTDSSIQFIATATAGYDHLDTSWLEQRRIAWCNAPGCNANSVAEYLVSALLLLHSKHGVALTGKTLGIIGYGAVGSHVAEKAHILGLQILLYDPFLIDTQVTYPLIDLTTLLEQSDFVSLHTPLTTTGIYPTYHLADATFFSRMKPGAVFINTARGEVADYAALLSHLNSGHLATAILDVWPNEPHIDTALLQKAAITTPHIAGHSRTGKINGTWQAYLHCCEYFNVVPTAANPLLHTPKHVIMCPSATDTVLATIWQVVKQAYNVEQDSLALKQAEDQFKQLRQGYYQRFEFADYQLKNTCDSTSVMPMLEALGFIGND